MLKIIFFLKKMLFPVFLFHCYNLFKQKTTVSIMTINSYTTTKAFLMVTRDSVVCSIFLPSR